MQVTSSASVRWRLERVSIISIVALGAWLGGAAETEAGLRPLFDAIRQVESGGDPDAVGDGGRSIGPYQIQHGYWRDSRVPGSYRKVRDPRYSERVMLAYWRRYCPTALRRLDYQTLARVHNGGPAGARRQATVPYWKKVRQELGK